MIINLTQHQATSEQSRDGVVDLAPEQASYLARLLTFENIPAFDEIERRARSVAKIADGYSSAMIGGAPYLMSALEGELLARNVKPIYSFSRRVSREIIAPDGTVVKTSTFQHIGWVEV